jgi:hypothetical protein
MILFHSQKHPELSKWSVINDVVMGGNSQSKFVVNKEGFGEFSGYVSLENNGGFSSVKYSIYRIDVDAFTKIKVKLKGDTLRYQLRLKTKKEDRHFYVSFFETSGQWQTIEFPLSEFYPTYRGRELQLSKYPGEHLEEIGILIANKKAQNFNLEIEQIEIL